MITESLLHENIYQGKYAYHAKGLTVTPLKITLTGEICIYAKMLYSLKTNELFRTFTDIWDLI